MSTDPRGEPWTISTVVAPMTDPFFASMLERFRRDADPSHAGDDVPPAAATHQEVLGDHGRPE